MESSANARKLQEEELEKLVKCRLRSEVEARKAIESTMKKAVQEARELKKELALMRQEQMQREQDSSRANSDLAESKQKQKSLEQRLRREVKSLSQQNAQLQDQITTLESNHSQQLQLLTSKLSQQENEFAAKQQQQTAEMESLKQKKCVAEEAKRRAQRLLKAKEQELTESHDARARLEQHVTQLRQEQDKQQQINHSGTGSKHHAKQQQMASMPGPSLSGSLMKLEIAPSTSPQREDSPSECNEQLKKRLEVKDLELRQLEKKNQEAVDRVRVEMASRLQQAEDQSAQQMERLQLDHHQQRQQLQDQYNELLVQMQQLQQQTKDALCKNEELQSRCDRAEASRQQDNQLRVLAEKAADAVERKLIKTCKDLEAMKTLFTRLEKALTAKGITMEFLLKQAAKQEQTEKESEHDRVERDDRSGKLVPHQSSPSNLTTLPLATGGPGKKGLSKPSRCSSNHRGSSSSSSSNKRQTCHLPAIKTAKSPTPKQNQNQRDETNE